jgi:hypothetical protein
MAIRSPKPGRAFLALVAALPVTCVAQQAPPVRLLLETERPAVALGEPVYVTARLRNAGSVATRLIPLLKPTDGLLAVSISGPNGEPLGFVPLSIRDTDTGPTDLPAGAEVATVFPVFYGASGWTMRTPGTYTLRARFTIHDGSGRPRELTSDPLSIRVGDQPGGIATTLLSGNTASQQAGKFLLWSGGDQLGEGQRLLTGVANQFANTPIADHVHLATGRSLARPFKDYSKGAVRPADDARAVAELERARDQMLPAYLRVQKYLTLAGSYQTLGRSADATRAAAAARALIAERPELVEFRGQLDRLGSAPQR